MPQQFGISARRDTATNAVAGLKKKIISALHGLGVKTNIWSLFALVVLAFGAAPADALAQVDNHVLLLGGNMAVSHNDAQYAPTSTRALTIEFWVRLTGTTDQHGRPFSKRGCSSSGITIPLTSSGQLRAELGGVCDEAGPMIPFNEWHHCAVVWSGVAQTVQFYVDGNLSIQKTVSASANLVLSNDALQFGAVCGRGMYGAMDNVRLWSIARTAEQISQTMWVQFTAEQAAQQNELVGSWSFEGSEPLADAAGNNPVGGLGGSASIGSESLPNVLSVPSQFATIQAAIDSATTGKSIEVAPGTYNEAIDFKGKAITVKATGTRANTIIDGTGLTTSVVRAVTGETSATVLQGFTIRNGPIGSASGTYRLGGGIFISSASPTIRNCAFTANQAAYGGGMYALYSNSLVENCTFSQNSGSADGGGIQLFGGSPIVRNCVVSDNTAGNRGGGFHVVQHNTGAATLDGCTISGNRSNVSDGGGISMAPLAGAAQKFLVSNSTITNNSAQERGGGLWALVNPANPQQNVTLTDNTICNNTSAISKRENVWALFEDGGNTICDCFADVSGNGDVDNGDLGFVLLFMGEPTDPDFIQPDQDMNGFIDSVDVGMVLLNMGGCP